MRALAVQLPRPSVRAVVIAAAVAMAATAAAALLIDSGGNEQASKAPRISYAPAPPPPGWKALRLPGAARQAFVPASWRTTKRDGVVSAFAPDRTVLVAVAATRARGDQLAAAVRELRRRYAAARPSAEALLRIAGLPGVAVEVALRTTHGQRLRALVISARGRRDRYLIEAFTRDAAPQPRVRELRRVLATFRLR